MTRIPSGTSSVRAPSSSIAARTPSATGQDRGSRSSDSRLSTNPNQTRTPVAATPAPGVLISLVDRYIYVDGSMTTATVFEMSFSWGDATPLPIVTLNSGAVIAEVNVWMLEKFDASGSIVTIGKSTATDDLMNSTEIDPTILSSFSTRPGKEYSAGEIVVLKIIPGGGCNKGRGVLSVYII